MKKYLFLTTWLFLFGAQKAFCAVESVSPELEHSLKTHSGEPGIGSIIFSLLFVIFLIYVTGVIYSKLNLVSAKKMRDQLKNYDLSKAMVLSTTQLGQGKNLHVIELDKKLYLIGATQNSINLIKELDYIKEEVTGIEKPKEADIDEAIGVLYGGAKEEPAEEFEVHKKYL